MKYCSRCILPDTRPGVVLDEEGVCLPCRMASVKHEAIDWDRRHDAFRDVLADAKAKSRGYDCVIPVSGGKDSTWQVVTCLDHGLNPLAVTWKSPGRSELGRQNLENLISLGVDHIDYQVNPEVERVFMYQSLLKHGSTAVPMHLAMFNIPLKVSLRFSIPLVVWGENSAFEYGGEKEDREGSRLTDQWLRSHGNTFGTTAEDWVGEHLSRSQLTPFFGPNEKDLLDAGCLAIFLGYYFKWDPTTSLEVAARNGFRSREEGPKTGYYNYADIDDDFMSIHHYIKWYKFGCTRLFDNLSIEIRNNRMSRSTALSILEDTGEQYPETDIRSLCEFLRIKESQFDSILESFRNHDIWYLDDGVWKIKGFIIDSWSWS